MSGIHTQTVARQRMLTQPVHPHRWFLMPGMHLSAMTRWSIAVLGLVIVICGCLLLSQAVQKPERFPVNHVDVMGTLDYADRSALMTMVQEHTAKGFYALEIDLLRTEVEQIEWVGKARVSRLWPSRITVEVQEHEPAARWNDNSLISKRLQVFDPPQLQLNSDNYQQWQRVFEPLPQLRGTPGRQSALLDNYRLYEQQLAKLDLSLALLDEDDRHSQTLVLANDVSVQLGYEHHELRMNRFMDVYPRVAEQFAGDAAAESALSFDMRYSNGFALGRVSDARTGQ